MAATAATGFASAHAGQLLVNGNFETGDFTGWDVNQQLDSQGGLFVVPNNGGNAPDSNKPYQLNATGGNFFAISDGTDNGSYVLSQFFRVGAHQKTPVISFQLFANNWGGPVADNGRDLHTFPNQNVEVDILLGSADPFTNDPSDIVATLYGPGADSGANPNPWVNYSSSLALAAGQYQIRFAETNNDGVLNMGVDNASVLALPEPATWAMMLLGVGAVGFAARRRRGAALAA